MNGYCQKSKTKPNTKPDPPLCWIRYYFYVPWPWKSTWLNQQNSLKMIQKWQKTWMHPTFTLELLPRDKTSQNLQIPFFSHFRQICTSELLAQLSIFHYSNCWKYYFTWSSMDGSLNQTSATFTASRAFFCASRQHFSTDQKSKILQFYSLWAHYKLSLHHASGKVWAIHIPAHSLLLTWLNSTANNGVLQ